MCSSAILYRTTLLQNPPQSRRVLLCQSLSKENLFAKVLGRCTGGAIAGRERGAGLPRAPGRTVASLQHLRPTSARSCSAWHRRRGRSRTGGERLLRPAKQARLEPAHARCMYCKHSRGHSNLMSSVCLCTICSKCSSTSSYAASRHCLVQKLKRTSGSSSACAGRP